MRVIQGFDLSSDFTIFFLVVSVLLLAFAVALAMATAKSKKRFGRGAHKVDDRIIDRNRELID